MCREGAWTELTAMVTAGSVTQSRLHGFYIAVIKIIIERFV